MSTTSTPLESSEEGRAFLQHRVAVAGVFGASIGGGFLTLRLLQHLASGLVTFDDWTMWFHFGGVASMTLMWMVCRTGQRSVLAIRRVETLSILGAAVFYTLMGVYVPVWQMPHYLITLAILSMVVARAIYVPSTARRTLLLTSAAGIPVIVATFWLYYNVDISNWTDVEASIRAASPLRRAMEITFFTAVWWGVAVALSTGASMTIFGLRKRVADARRLGQYELIEKLGEGGMGVVYHAQHAMLRRPTAVKLLPPEKVGEQSLARFEKEVRQTARLTHPNTVTIFDYGRTPEGVFYYAMELLDGSTLQRVVEINGAQPPARVARVFEQAARALSEAHEAGLIHRDIKPANIMLVRQGGEADVTKVVDFGLVKEVDRAASSTSLTQADTLMGTPQYLSPEAITSPESVDARSDLYALGGVAYYLLTGHHVFSGNGVVEVCSKHLYEPPAPLPEGVPKGLAALVLRCLAKDPSERPQSAAKLAVAIQECASGPKWTKQQAEEWWAEHGPALSKPIAEDKEPALRQTLNIDLDRSVRGDAKTM
ncbi:MAG: serine/threonine-protein kinase [Polyangiales bacterium]